MTKLAILFQSRADQERIEEWLDANHPDRWSFGGTWMVANNVGDWINGFRYNLDTPGIDITHAVLMRMLLPDIIAIEGPGAEVLWGTARYLAIARGR